MWFILHVYIISAIASFPFYLPSFTPTAFKYTLLCFSMSTPLKRSTKNETFSTALCIELALQTLRLSLLFFLKNVSFPVSNKPSKHK